MKFLIVSRLLIPMYSISLSVYNILLKNNKYYIILQLLNYLFRLQIILFRKWPGLKNYIMTCRVIYSERWGDHVGLFLYFPKIFVVFNFEIYNTRSYTYSNKIFVSFKSNTFLQIQPKFWIRILEKSNLIKNNDWFLSALCCR